MNWLVYALGAAVALAAADVMIKLGAGKVSTSLGILLYGVVPVIWALIWLAMDPHRGMKEPPQLVGVLCALGVGVTFTLVTIGLYGAFKAGAPISVVSPVVRLGGLALAAAVGLMLLKEPITTRLLLGLALATCGIYLIIKR